MYAKYHGLGYHVIFLGESLSQGCSLEQCRDSPAESSCTNQEIVLANIRSVKISSPDVSCYLGLVNCRANRPSMKDGIRTKPWMTICAVLKTTKDIMNPSMSQSIRGFASSMSARRFKSMYVLGSSSSLVLIHLQKIQGYLQVCSALPLICFRDRFVRSPVSSSSS